MNNLNTPRITAPTPLTEADFDRAPSPAEAATEVGAEPACCNGNCNQGDACPRRAAMEAVELPHWTWVAAVAVVAVIAYASKVWPWGFAQ